VDIAKRIPSDQSDADRGKITAGALSGLALLWLAMLLVGGNKVDRFINVSVHVNEQPWLTPVLLVTRLGDWAVLLALPLLAAAWLLLQRRRNEAIFLVCWTVAGRALILLQKATLQVARPEEHEHLVRVDSFAFPSGHAGNSMIVYLLLALVLVDDPRRRRLAVAGAVLLALLIGVSRIMLSVHWTTDVVGGWSFGLIWVILGLALMRRLDLRGASDG
jgi:undecaprenyl-diphosphatase